MTPVLFLTMDYLAVVLTGQMSTSIYDMSIHRSYLYFWLPLTFLLFLAQSRIYNTMQPFIYTVRSIFYGISYAMLACVAALYFFTSWQAPRSFFIVFWLLMLITIYCERLAVSFYLKHRHHLYEDVIMIGAGKTA
ncbi:hypothetical protein SAMN05216366_1471, partial [Selenomonas ruminantium]